MELMYNSMLQQTNHVINSNNLEHYNDSNTTQASTHQPTVLPTGTTNIVIQKTLPVGNHVKSSTREKILNNEIKKGQNIQKTPL